MAEGGEPPIVYNIENVGTLHVASEQTVANINRSSIGILSIGSNQRLQQGDSNDGDRQHGNEPVEADFALHGKGETQITRETDMTWLQHGKFGMYNKRPLHKEAKVYLGKQNLISKTSRNVAIKRIPYREKNLKEIELLTILDHPNVVRIIDAGEELKFGHWIYIVMELCSQNLQNYIDEDKTKPLDFKKSLSSAKQILKGLLYLHENKVIHRDLKPENILISLCKKFLKLSDFGLSKEIKESRSDVTVTTIGAGSEGYRAPETYQAGKNISTALDIFSLGIIYHVIFTNGKHPFGPDPNEWSYNIRKNQNLGLSGIPEFGEPSNEKKTQLINLLHQSLQHEPSDRPSAKAIKEHVFFKNSAKGDAEAIEKEISTISVFTTGTRPKTAEAQEYAKQHSSFSTGNRGKLDEMWRRDEKFAKLNASLKIAERELLLGGGEDDKSMQRIRDLVFSSKEFSVDELLENAEHLTENENFLQSLILHHVSNDLYERQRVLPDDAAKWISNLLSIITNPVVALIKSGGKSRDIGIKYGLEYMEILLTKLRDIENVNPSVGAQNEAHCLVKMSYACHFTGDYQKMIQFCDGGIAILEKEFGEDAEKYVNYGLLLKNLAVAHEMIGNFCEAKVLHKKSAELQNKSPQSNQKESTIQTIKSMLVRTLSRR